MARKKITQDTQANVLLKSRRRCCICFGLNRDTSIKQGQIAHLDGNSTNDKEENLAFLCLVHHDQYDSSTRQSKNFTIDEVRKFKSELIEAINMAFFAEVQFGEAKGYCGDNISGHYIRDSKYESAEIKVQRLRDGKYHVSGYALWGINREYGPNIGELDFIGELTDNVLRYSYNRQNREPYRAVFSFKDNKLNVTEENWIGVFGMNVMFSGEYQRAAQPSAPPDAAEPRR